MLFNQYDPLKQKTLQILDLDGQVLLPKLVPDIDKETLLKMYKIMTLGRIADIKAVQFQRQGRMLTYAPNQGQEAAQVGPMSAASLNDWLAISFRELNAMLYQGATLKQLFLYWYGNEQGSQFEPSVKVLPVNVPIGSQISHAAGLAYAAKIQKKDEVAIAFIGDGGTSHGEFHEGINFASVMNVPLVIIVQNNHWAISTPRSKATKAETIAQKAIAYGIPGIQVDGNDVLAMHLATKEAIKRAKSGQGPTLIEAVTYRMGPHTTSDNPKLYRSDEEVEKWIEKDPIKRFKNYLINQGIITEDFDKKLNEDYQTLVLNTFKDVETSGLVSLEAVFNHTYETKTQRLEEQYSTLQKYYEMGVK